MLLLLDEPFSALDVYTGEHLRSDLLRIWSTRQIKTRSIVLVTHSVEEAVMMSDRILLLGAGTLDGCYHITQRREAAPARMQPLTDKISETLSRQIAAAH